ncbi:MAG: alcohol dehydrogenase, propanol-preferring [Betaproteobacteria bacterium]|nr:alcohol dehydrogenase, propanol-preferring [Betaproteobacteria bacterium]
MEAMVLQTRGAPLELAQLPLPAPGPEQLLLRVHACGVCRTDFHVVDGDLTQGKLPVIPGHEVVASVVSCRSAVSGYASGDRVGVPWLGYTCGVCEYCVRGQENLCENARFTGYDLDGGYAEYIVAHQRYCLPLPPEYGDASAAPFLCAGPPVLRIVHRAIAGFLLKEEAGLKRCAGDTGAVTLIQRFGSAANLNIHLHCLVLDGVYRRTEREPDFQEARAPHSR